MSDRFGAKWFIVLGVAFSGLLNLFYPLIARESLPLFIACRSIQVGIHDANTKNCI